MPTYKRTLKKHYNLESTVKKLDDKLFRAWMSATFDGKKSAKIRYGRSQEEAYRICLRSVIEEFKRITKTL